MIYIYNFNFVNFNIKYDFIFFLFSKKKKCFLTSFLFWHKSRKSFANKCQIKFRNKLHKLYDQIRKSRPQIGNRNSDSKRYSRGVRDQGHHNFQLTARLTSSLVVQFRPKTDPASKINQSCGVRRSSRRSLIQRWTPRCQGH